MRIFTLLFTLLVSLNSFALDAYFKHYVFFDKDGKPYVENNIIFNGSSLSYSSIGEGFQANIELTYIFKQGEKIAEWSKKSIKSPITNDTINELRDFLDLQRFSLDYGDYDLTIQIVDINNPKDTNISQVTIAINEQSTKAYFSDIMLVTSVSNNQKQNVFQRGNLDIIPRVSGFYDPFDTTLTYYLELYNSKAFLGENQDFVLSTQIINLENDEVLTDFHSYKRKKSNDVDVTLQTINIKNLLSGNYLLNIEARNRNNEAFASKKVIINRYNQLDITDSNHLKMLEETFVMQMSEDSLRAMVYCLRPRVGTLEKDFIDKNFKTADTTTLRAYLYGHWQAESSADPESAYKTYLVDVDYVRKNFKAKNIDGCATDRGRVYLQYGKPSSVIAQPSDPTSYPYEIWHYYKTPKKANAKFLFYDPTRIVGDYKLLHSDVPGELQDYQWQNRLEAPRGMPSTLDETPNTDNVGNRASDYWNLPR